MGIDFDVDAFEADIQAAIDEVDDLEQRYTGGDAYFVGTAVEYAVFPRIRHQRHGS